MTERLRLAFMGSPDFAVPVVAALAAAGHDIVCVYSQPPRPAGRGKKLRRTPVHVWADDQGLPVRTPSSLKGEHEQKLFSDLDIDAAIVVAYGLILPQAVLDAPRLGCMNMHASLLPRWRGAAPVHRAIMAGDQMTGVQAMIMEAGLDTGPILATETTNIMPSDTTGDLLGRLADLAAGLAVTTLQGWADGTIRATPQASEGVEYAHKIEADDRRIDWLKPASAIDCQIRAMAPTPGAWFEYAPDPDQPPMRIKVLDSRLIDDAERAADLCAGRSTPITPGTVLGADLVVMCGDQNLVELRVLQKPGAKPMNRTDFLRGLPVSVDTVFC